jgi:tetratricopeptide (TPR) repeat protein
MALVLGASVLVRSAAPGAPTSEEIAKAVQDLASDNFRVRQKASALLWAAGKQAEPALLKALKSKDKEVARRARDILDKFRYGIYPDTPAEVVALVKQYRAGDDEAKRKAIDALNKLGSPGHAILIKLSAVEEDANLRRALFDCLRGDVVPSLLADRRFDNVEELLELSLKNGDKQAMRNYAAFLYLTGRLDARIPAWSAKAKKLTGFQAAETLMYMYRVKGDYASARKAAQRTEKKALPTAILFEQADWKELAAGHGPPSESSDPLEQLSFSAAYHRLAGNAKEFDKAIAAVREFAAKNPEYAKRVAIALLLNNRAKEALDLLTKSKEYGFTFDLLVAQHRYREAFDLAANAKAPDNPLGAEDQFNLKLAVARTHALLGEQDTAIKLLAKLVEEVRDPKNSFRTLKVIEAEYQAGLKDQAFAHCVKALPQVEKETVEAKLFGHVFPDRGNQAAVWWQFLRRQHSGEDIGTTFKRLREVCEIKVPAKEFVALVQKMDKASAGFEMERERKRWFSALGETCLDYNQRGLAQDFLAKADSADSLIRLGDLLAENKLWLQAAARYEQAWKLNRTQAAPLYLRGWALAQAGQKEDGRKLMDLAHLIPLANDEVRFKLAQELGKKGLVEAANREFEFITHSGSFSRAEISNAVRGLGMLAYAAKKYDQAANYQERTLLVCLGNVYFIRAGAYLSVPAAVHLIQAKALLAQKKVEDALKETQRCLESLTGDLEMVINIVPDLEKLGRKAEASKLFTHVFDHFEKVCKAYPKSAQNHNSAAWLAVCCRRQLDKALEHSRKAVELAPQSPGYLDTLAEVYYQRGDKAQALKLMKQCIEMSPRTDYYHKQIKRFEAPGPPSETPR